MKEHPSTGVKMKMNNKNFSRFYAILKTLPGDDKNSLKEDLVYQFTNGRTCSLRKMRDAEYNSMCDSIDMGTVERLRAKMVIKKHRSAVLKRLQLIGVDTTSWDAIDDFCLRPQIAGKRFYELSIDELDALIPKLIAIGNKPKKGANNGIPEVCVVVNNNNQMYS